MELVLTIECNNWACLCHSVNKDINAGTVASTRTTREHYWKHWEKFLPGNLNLYVQGMDHRKQVTLLQLFARWVWEGEARRGHQVKTSSIQAALSAIELAGFDNPLHQTGTNIYHALIAMQTKTY